MSHGAEFFYMDHDAFTGRYTGPVGALVMSGDIEPGDYDRLLKRLHDDPQRFLSQDKLILASGTGDVDEAMKIGRFLKTLHTEISDSPLTGRCVDACFFIYVAAFVRCRRRERFPARERSARGPRGARHATRARRRVLAERFR